jgi:hypothetical protein
MKLAEDYQAKFKGTYNTVDIDEWEVDKEKDLTIKTIVRMSFDGTVISTRKELNYDPGFYALWDDLLWVVETDSKERAIKVTNEKRAQIIAANLWDKGKIKEIIELFSHS